MLKRPVKQIYLVATATMDMFRMLERLRYPGFREPMRRAGTSRRQGGEWRWSILYAGKYSEPDYERIVEKSCSLAIESTMIYHCPQVKEQLENLACRY